MEVGAGPADPFQLPTQAARTRTVWSPRRPSPGPGLVVAGPRPDLHPRRARRATAAGQLRAASLRAASAPSRTPPSPHAAAPPETAGRSPARAAPARARRRAPAAARRRLAAWPRGAVAGARRPPKIRASDCSSVGSIAIWLPWATITRRSSGSAPARRRPGRAAARRSATGRCGIASSEPRMTVDPRWFHSESCWEMTGSWSIRASIWRGP